MANLLVFIQTNISRKEKFRYISEKCEIFANIDIRHSRTFSCRPPLRRFFWLFHETSRGKRANYCICQDNLEPLAFLVVVLRVLSELCAYSVCVCIGEQSPRQPTTRQARRRKPKTWSGPLGILASRGCFSSAPTAQLRTQTINFKINIKRSIFVFMKIRNVAIMKNKQRRME